LTASDLLFASDALGPVSCSTIKENVMAMERDAGKPADSAMQPDFQAFQR